MGHGSDQYWGDRIAPLKNYGKHGRLNFRSVKLYADGLCSSRFLLAIHYVLTIVQLEGALGSWGAALLEPYSDRPETKGLLLNSEETLRSLVYRFWKDGWQTVWVSH